MTTTPARAARRQLLVDRFAEQLTEWGAPGAEVRARALLDIVDAQGFVLPPAIEDAPPPRPPASDLDGPGYAAYLAARQALANRPKS